MTTLSGNSTLLDATAVDLNGPVVAAGPAWRRVVSQRLMLPLLLAACVFASFDAWRDLAGIGWVDEESSHILLAPITFAWIFLVRRHRWATLSARGRWVGPFVMALGWALWSFGFRHRVHTAWHVGAVVLVVGGAITAVGTDLIWRFLPAFGALVFLIPMAGERRQQLAAPMQVLTAKATQNVCELFGMVVDRRGSLLSSNGVDVAIAEACNGMRLVLTLVIVSYLYAFITPLRGWVRVVLLVCSPLTAVVCNVIRLVPTVWMFAHTSRPTAEMFHDYSGWFMLLVGFLLQMSVIGVLRWAGFPVDAGVAAPERRGA